MLAGKLTSVTWGRENRLAIEMEMEGLTSEFKYGQRVLVTIIPDDAEIQRAYARGKSDGSKEARWALEEFLNKDGGL